MEEVRLIEVKEDILSDNAVVADNLRERLKASQTFMVNMMASPGTGKTTLLMKQYG